MGSPGGGPCNILAGASNAKSRDGKAQEARTTRSMGAMGMIEDALKMTRSGNGPIPGRGAHKKTHYRQRSLAEGKGLTGNRPISGRGASKKTYFRQGSCADGKGLTGNRPIPGRGASKKSHFRQGSFVEGKGLANKKSHFRQGAFADLAGAQAKNPFQAGVVCRGQGLDRK